MENIHILKTDMEVSDFARKLSSEAAIAIDLEADALHNYREKICLIQVSTPELTVLIDPLSVTNLNPLKPVLENPDIVKIFHAADYDLRSLKRDYDITINGLFDTMISAQLLGERRVGLADLLLKYFNVELDKSFQKADWSIRPLSAKMIEYAANDTRYLHQLRELFVKRLEALGRMTWVEEECSLLESVQFAENGGPLCLRIKGAGTLSRRELGVLEALLQWREQEGEKRNRPVYKVLGNKPLLELAKRVPLNESGMKGIEGLPQRLIDRYAKVLLTEITRGKDVPDDALPFFPKRPRKPKDPAREDRFKMLKRWREQTVGKYAIDPGVLINNSTLEILAVENPQSISQLNMLEGLKNWQKEELGEGVLQTLAEMS